MATYSSISKKPLLISKSEFLSLGKDINLVGYDPFYDYSSNINISFSPKLLNWVEPYIIEGVTKTLFYTQVNSNLKVGDRVFIINGNYDSNLLIESDKYKKGSDGYKILYIDNCKVVLDIEYSGIDLYQEDIDDNFVKVYCIKNSNEFLHVNRQMTTRDGNFKNKFSYYQNNMIFADGNFNIPLDRKWGLGYDTFIVTATQGFCVNKGVTFSWTNITSSMSGGSFSYSAFPINNGRIKIFNNNFIYLGKEFREGFIYKWNSTNGEWEVDITYFKPFLSKSNFRDGNFNGIWNSGLFGRQDKQITWVGNSSTWNTGTLLNSYWENGTINSIYTSTYSYFSSFDINGKPYQKMNDVNNAGRGFNFIVDSNINQSTIINGSLYTTIIGTQSSTYSVVENVISNYTTIYKNIINEGFFDTCKFYNSYIENSELKNIISNNTRIEKSKSINSYFKNSVFSNSAYNSDNIIKILEYDELTASEYKDAGIYSNYPIGYKVYKFYIDKIGYERLKTGNTFYIKGLKINDNTKNVISFFDKKFKIDSWTNYDDELISGDFVKSGYEYSAFLLTPGDNSYNFTSVQHTSTSFYTSIYETNSNSNYYSVDIWVSKYDINKTLSPSNLDFNKGSTYTPPIYATASNFIGNTIDITNAYIVDSNFESGLFENSDWNSGYHIGENNDSNITMTSSNLGIYNLSIDVNDFIKATTRYNGSYSESKSLDDVLFLDSIDFNNSSSITRISDSYKVGSSSSNSIFYLKELGTYSIISGLTSSGTFSTIGAQNRYGHFKSLKINKSNIKSGLFRRAYITNSLIQDVNYDSSDKDYNNLDKIRNLVISDSIFSNKSNILSSATYLYSFFLSGSDTWNDGIIQNSIWINGTFSNGTIKESRWINGSLTGGYFYNSKTFDGKGAITSPYYYSENISSFYKNGIIPNNRNSWENGTFINGDFYKSDWENGTFSGGRFWNSKWYDGNFINGTIGSNQISVDDTKIYNGTISYGVVENATIFTHDTSYGQTMSNSINWLNGVFNNGVFGSDISHTFSNSAIWHQGTFNGGQFVTNAKWKNGIFNGGKFLSAYGWSQSSPTQSGYGWEQGIFNNGEFGNAQGSTNSTWYTGEFNDGIFKGRVWNNGIFLYGEFQGCGATAVGGLTSSNANQFVTSYTQSYWGRWKDGIFTDIKDKFIKDAKTSTMLKKSNTINKIKTAKFKNGLWELGTFSHPSGEMYNSVWLDGTFERGKFNNSSFNPYVNRNGSTSSSFNFNDNTCCWKNGELNDSEFYISTWENGKFIMGTGVGMIWKNGTVNYMNAFNIFWENGLWRNGNWYGSSFEFDGVVNDDYTYQILKRGMAWSVTSSCHIWNIFQESENIINTFTASNSSPI